MTHIFCLVYPHSHCEEGHDPDAAIRISRPPVFITYYLFFILYSFYEPQSGAYSPAKE